MNESPLKFDLIGLGLVLLAFIGGVVFCAGALASEDPLWFSPVFDEKPLRIVVHMDGCDAIVVEGMTTFQPLVGAINQSLSQIDGYEPGFGLSPQTLQEYRTQTRAVEIFYPKPISIHTPYRFGHPDTLLIPLSGALGESRSLFGGRGGEYWAGALRLKTIAPVQQATEHVQCK